MSGPDSRRYHPQHTWARSVSRGVEIGLSDLALSQLGEIAYIELPAVGFRLAQGETFGSIESVKVSSELVSPVDGTVTEVNSRVLEDPSILDLPSAEGVWLVLAGGVAGAEVERLLEASDYLAAHADRGTS